MPERSFWDVLDEGLRKQARRHAPAVPHVRRPRQRGAGFYLTEKAERLLARDRTEDR